MSRAPTFKTISANSRVLVAVPHRELAIALAAMLRGLGVRYIEKSHDSENTLRLLAGSAYDAVVLDHAIKPENGISLTRRMRLIEGCRNAAVPVIMISAEASRKHIEDARDAGIHEFLRLPVSAEALSGRLSSAIANPRAFIRATDYTGPDRRRRDNADHAERRQTPKAS